MKGNFVFISTLCLFVLFIDALRKGKSGPYKSQLMSARKCANPKPPYLKEWLPRIDLELYNTSSKVNLVRVNISVAQIYPHLMANVKIYKWENGKWQYNFMIHSDHCRGTVGLLFKIMNIQYDSEQCSVPIGDYYIQDIEPNSLEHALTPTRTYGKVKTRFEVLIKSGTIFCYEFNTLVTPA